MADDKRVKVYFVPDWNHEHNKSKIDAFKKVAQNDKIIFGIEGNHCDSTLPKNCFGLEDPLVHFLVDVINKISDTKNSIKYILSYQYPACTKGETRDEITAILTSFFKKTESVIIHSAKNSGDFFVNLIATACVLLKDIFDKIKHDQLFATYGFTNNEAIGFASLSAKEMYDEVIKKLNMASDKEGSFTKFFMKYKMDFRNYIFAHFIKQIIKERNLSNLPLVIFVGAEHLGNVVESGGNNSPPKLTDQDNSMYLKSILSGKLNKQLTQAQKYDIQVIEFDELQQKIGDQFHDSKTATSSVSQHH
jgi:hypothetical protein